jgi:hypothetical protein
MARWVPVEAAKSSFREPCFGESGAFLYRRTEPQNSGVTSCRGVSYTVRMDVAALAAIELLDSDAKPRHLGDFWSDRSAVLVFLRHFG